MEGGLFMTLLDNLGDVPIQSIVRNQFGPISTNDHVKDIAISIQ